MTYLGEPTYELFIPVEQALHVYDRKIEKGKDFDVRHAGLRALGSLRMVRTIRRTTLLIAGCRFQHKLASDHEPFTKDYVRNGVWQVEIAEKLYPCQVSLSSFLIRQVCAD
jgi:hypothetical protein